MLIDRWIAPGAITSGIAGVEPKKSLVVWCGIVGSDWECVYQTLGDCEKWMRPEGQMCAPNPRGNEE